MLSMPYAYSNSGWQLGLALTVLVAAVETYTLCVCCEYAEQAGATSYAMLVGGAISPAALRWRAAARGGLSLGTWQLFAAMGTLSVRGPAPPLEAQPASQCPCATRMLRTDSVGGRCSDTANIVVCFYHTLFVMPQVERALGPRAGAALSALLYVYLLLSCTVRPKGKASGSSLKLQLSPPPPRPVRCRGPALCLVGPLPCPALAAAFAVDE